MRHEPRSTASEKSIPGFAAQMQNRALSAMCQSVVEGVAWLPSASSANLSILYLFVIVTAPFCLKLYQEILQSPNGALVWSFFKPILHGKILYTPDTPEIKRVIQKVSPGERGADQTCRGHIGARREHSR